MSFPRRPVWRFALLALLLHLLLIIAITVEKKPEPPEPPLSGKFVKRRPLRQRVLQRSMSLPRPVRPLQRSVVSPQAFARSVVPQAIQPSVPQLLTRRQIIPTRVRPSVVLGRGISSHGRLRSAPVTVAVQATDRLDLGLELLDVEALDTGQYRALVIVDLTDKRKLEGFVHLSAVALPSALQGAKEMDPEEEGGRTADQG